MATDVHPQMNERGSGRAVLVLHGGGGPATVAGLAAQLAATYRVLTPTHPGWGGTELPESIGSIADLAQLYLDLLTERDLRDVVVIGSSIGGWIADEMALRDVDGRIAQLVIINGVGVAVEGETITDFFSLDPRGVAEHSFHDPERFVIDPAALSAEQRAVQASNMESLRALAGDPYMHDPTLLARLAEIRIPALVLWGESDRIATAAYGKAHAAGFADGRFELIREAGHLPQIEQPERTLAALRSVL